MQEIKDLFLKPSKIGILLSYVLIYFIGASFIMIFLGLFIANQYNVDYKGLIDYASGVLNDEIYYIPSCKLNAYTMAIAYGLTFVFVLFYARNYLKADFLKLKSNPRKAIIMAIGLCAIFYFVSWGIEELISLAIGDQTSGNQASIEGMITDGNAFVAFLAVVVFAPIIEELVYRKVIFEVCNKKSIILSYIVSSLVFGLIHMISPTAASPLVIFLLALSYISSGILLSTVYHLSGQNIWISTFVHVFNNLLAFIFIII